MEIYVVTMYRKGDRERHSYVLGAYTDGDRAVIEAEKEYMWRDGKYKPEVLRLETDISLANLGWAVIHALDAPLDYV
jgi:hypothetical protein